MEIYPVSGARSALNLMNVGDRQNLLKTPVFTTPKAMQH